MSYRGPGQEKHLPHEAWHVVQQKQGRVKPTMQMKGKVNVNDDARLEKEADVMGKQALQRQPLSISTITDSEQNKTESVQLSSQFRETNAIQLKAHLSLSTEISEAELKKTKHSHTGDVVQLALRGTRNVLSGANSKLNQEQGEAIMDRLTSGDTSVWRELTPKIVDDPIVDYTREKGEPKNKADSITQGREYGLILENETNEAHIIIGEDGGVNWSPFLKEGQPVAHSHPLATPGVKRNKYLPTPDWSDRSANNIKLKNVIEEPLRNGTFLPTIGDVQFMIQQGLKEHTVFTPYTIINQKGEFLICNAVGGDVEGMKSQKLSWKIHDPEVIDMDGEPDQQIIVGVMSAKIGGNEVWKDRFQSPFLVSPLSTNFTFGNPAIKVSKENQSIAKKITESQKVGFRGLKE